MRSISARLTLWYALSATATLAILFLIGYQLLKDNLTRGLDALDYSEYRQIVSHLGPSYDALSSTELDERIRDVSRFSSALFYISIENPRSNVHFSSENLRGKPIPDVKGQRAYDARVAGVGDMRVNEFLLPPLDVTIATPIGQMRAGMRSYIQVCGALLAAMLVASTAIGFGLSRLLLRPFARSARRPIASVRTLWASAFRCPRFAMRFPTWRGC